MKQMTSKLREKIQMYIKNRMDISELINDVNLDNETLTGAIIKTFNIHDRVINNCILTRVTIGDDNKITNWNRCRLINCNLKRMVLKGKLWARYAIVKNCNLTGAYLPYVNYRFADFTGSTFCNTVFTMGTSCSVGAKFDKKVIEEFFNISKGRKQ